MRTFAEFKGSRDNNFNLLRFAAAFLVILSHSFVLSGGIGTPEPPSSLIGVSFGTIGVYIFFTASGFLITMSYCARHDLLAFLWARALRIFPALVVCALLSAFVLGLAFTTIGTGSYLNLGSTYKYVLNNTILLPLGFQETLPGVFPSNPVPSVVNGSLWTLPIELRMYLIVALIGSVGLLRRGRLLSIGIALCLSSFLVALLIGSFKAPGLRLAMFFLAGVVFYLNRQLITTNSRVLIGLAIMAALSWETRLFGALAAIFLVYGSIWFAYVPAGWLRKFNTVGDYSYGLYIYAFPVQQGMVALHPGIGPAGLFSMSFLATLLLAVASWHLIEKPALGLKETQPFNLKAVSLQLIGKLKTSF